MDRTGGTQAQLEGCGNTFPLSASRQRKWMLAMVCSNSYFFATERAVVGSSRLQEERCGWGGRKCIKRFDEIRQSPPGPFLHVHHLIIFYLRSLQDVGQALRFLVPFNHPLLRGFYLTCFSLSPPLQNRFSLASGD